MREHGEFDLALFKLGKAKRTLKESRHWVGEIDFLSKETQDWYKNEIDNLLTDVQDLADKFRLLYNSENPNRPKPKVII